MSYKFNIGDKVRVEALRGFNEGVPTMMSHVGKVYTVVSRDSIFGHGYFLSTDKHLRFCEDSLALAPIFTINIECFGDDTTATVNYDGKKYSERVHRFKEDEWDSEMAVRYLIDKFDEDIFNEINKGHKRVAKPKFENGDEVIYNRNGKQYTGVVINNRVCDNNIVYVDFDITKMWCEVDKLQKVEKKPIKEEKDAGVVKKPEFKVGDRVKLSFDEEVTGTLIAVSEIDDKRFIMKTDKVYNWTHKADWCGGNYLCADGKPFETDGKKNKYFVDTGDIIKIEDDTLKVGDRAWGDAYGNRMEGTIVAKCNYNGSGFAWLLKTEKPQKYSNNGLDPKGFVDANGRQYKCDGSNTYRYFYKNDLHKI